MKPEKLGATGSFPDGKLNKYDEGELRVAITKSNGKVVIDFGKSVSWVAMTPEEAKNLSTLILKHAE